MAQFQLADIQAAADKRFGDFEVVTDLESGDVARFIPTLRQPKKIRRQLAAIVDLEARTKAAVENDTDDDLFDMFRDYFRVSARSAADYKKLEKAIGDDPAVWTDLFNMFTEEDQAGEA